MSKATAPDALAPHTWISATLMAIPFLLGACASKKDSVIPSTGPTMLEIYRKHMTDLDHTPSASGAPRRAMSEHDTSRYVRTALNETESPFARLPNPDLVMYVFPHLSAHGGYPVPGYSTVFPMYEGVEYALPGELRSTPEEMPKATLAPPASAAKRALHSKWR